jgi:hypothetical protein
MTTSLKDIAWYLIAAAIVTGASTARAQQVATPVPPAVVAPIATPPPVVATPVAPSAIPIPVPLIAMPAEAQQVPTTQPPRPIQQGQPGPRPSGQPGQQPPPRAPQPAPPVAQAMVPPPAPGQPVNVRIDLTISDEGAGTAPLKKTVSMTVADRESGQIRSEAYINTNIPGPLGGQSVPLHVDARPSLLPDGRIKVHMTLNYNVTFASGARPPTREDVVNSLKTEIREQLAFVLENGKPLVVSQSADPISDRRLTVEIKATLLK